MVQSKKLIPEIYSQSYDLSIFTGLLDLIYTGREVDVLRLKNAHSPNRAFKEDLRHLSSFFNLSTDNRDLLANYRFVIKQKGTLIAIKAAIEFAINAEMLDSGVKVDLTLPTSKKQTSDRGEYTESQEDYLKRRNFPVITAYADFAQIDIELLEELLRRVLPVTAFIQVRPLSERPAEDIELSSL